MVGISRTITTSSIASNAALNVQEIEAQIAQLVDSYSAHDSQKMCSGFSDGYCLAAQELLRSLDGALTQEELERTQ
ncbi:hypothetical protein FBU59_006977 [Linderina macrospora]|uniref:Uncharacterized protein n=1 Tax=Linderina macrospora TaxID=4868 RepID=A0ACC1IYA4_9FUNG|nr:hypothetical protein FBU59_006977 [Linderina macrospora]